SFLTPKVVGGKLPARIGSCRARQESDGSLALFVYYNKIGKSLENKKDIKTWTESTEKTI
ncbi:hypothetical protein, partial [Lactobacillus delbrueckii]|uniref:hypothetical protein n=1 Tax=Lactobacillus delbrueckii TaxID=1584 RepID=UPI0021A271F7